MSLSVAERVGTELKAISISYKTAYSETLSATPKPPNSMLWRLTCRYLR